MMCVIAITQLHIIVTICTDSDALVVPNTVVEAMPALPEITAPTMFEVSNILLRLIIK